MRNRILFLLRTMDAINRQPTPVKRGRFDSVRAERSFISESGATPVDPLEIYIEVDVLRTQLADALEALHANEDHFCTSPERRAAWLRALEQRRRFLAWLRRVEGGRVFTALYPETTLSDGEEEGPERADDDGETTGV